MDEGNGLLYMRARYYDPEIGRFINKDPIGLASGINVYAYAKGNPANLIDPSGLLNISITRRIMRFYGPTKLAYLIDLIGNNLRLTGNANIAFRVDPNEFYGTFKFEGTFSGRPVSIEGSITVEGCSVGNNASTLRPTEIDYQSLLIPSTPFDWTYPIKWFPPYFP
jgi:hypothetical protein